MASHNRADVMTTIRSDGAIPIFYNADLDTSKEVAQCIVAGGLSTLEFTNRGEGALDLLADLVPWARTELPELVLGVGSIVDEKAAAEAIDLGANFVFAPALSVEVAELCNDRDIPYVPGCATLTEIQTAIGLGCDLVKLFPADSIGGPAFLSAIRAPCPWIEAVPTGGVAPTAQSIKPWFDAGAPAVGLGSKLLADEIVDRGDWDEVSKRVAATVAAVKEARG